MKRTTAIIACAVGLASICASLVIGYRAGERSSLRKMRAAFKTQTASSGWVSKDIADNSGAMIDWLTLCVCRGTDGPYWTMRNGGPLDRQALDVVLGKLSSAGISSVFVYGQENATVQQVEETLDILKEHSFSNVLMFTRVQGILKPPFEWSGELEEIEPNHTSDGIRQPADGSPKPTR